MAPKAYWRGRGNKEVLLIQLFADHERWSKWVTIYNINSKLYWIDNIQLKEIITKFKGNKNKNKQKMSNSTNNNISCGLMPDIVSIKVRTYETK